jgi:uncharacterized Zn-binding protein involved in type VI secretion
MPQVARITDPISHGGSIVGGASATFVNGLAVARQTDPVICAIHGPQTITGGLPSDLVEGLPIARVGDSISCGAVISDGSPNQYAG